MPRCKHKYMNPGECWCIHHRMSEEYSVKGRRRRRRRIMY